MPAVIIMIAPTRSGAARPGSVKYTSPAAAHTSPIHCSGCGRVPEITAAISIVTCTDPNSSSAPVPVVRLT